MNEVSKITLLLTLSFIGFYAVHGQDNTIQNSKNIFSDSSYSSAYYYERGLILKSVSYSHTAAYVIKQTKTERFHFQLDGSIVSIDVELYKREDDTLFCVKSFTEKEDKLDFRMANKLIYQTSTESRGGGSMVYRLVDVKDNQAFTVFNHINHCKTIMSRNGDRWLSIYSNSNTGFSDWSIPAEKYIYVDTKKYGLIWSIVYSNEDEIFDIIDVYSPSENQNTGRYKGFRLEKFSILGDSLQTGTLYPNNYFSLEADGTFQDLIIDVYLKDHTVQIPIKGLKICAEHVSLDGLIFRRRDLSD